jgi:hypothetical protein
VGRGETASRSLCPTLQGIIEFKNWDQARTSTCLGEYGRYKHAKVGEQRNSAGATCIWCIWSIWSHRCRVFQWAVVGLESERGGRQGTHRAILLPPSASLSLPPINKWEPSPIPQFFSAPTPPSRRRRPPPPRPPPLRAPFITLSTPSLTPSFPSSRDSPTKPFNSQPCRLCALIPVRARSLAHIAAAALRFPGPYRSETHSPSPSSQRPVVPSTGTPPESNPPTPLNSPEHGFTSNHG